MKFYFNSLLDSGEKNYVRPNKNCMQPLLLDRRLRAWLGVQGRQGPDDRPPERQGVEMPYRALKCQTCCSGFFGFLINFEISSSSS
jgi:hypothetical protein